MTHRYVRSMRADDSSFICPTGVWSRLPVGMFIALTSISPAVPRAVTDLHLPQSGCHNAHSQCSCYASSPFSCFVLPSCVNKHLVAISYSQLLCACGLCRSERCQFTDQRPAIQCTNSVRSAVRTHATGLERNVRQWVRRCTDSAVSYTCIVTSSYSHF